MADERYPRHRSASELGLPSRRDARRGGTAGAIDPPRDRRDTDEIPTAPRRTRDEEQRNIASVAEQIRDVLFDLDEVTPPPLTLDEYSSAPSGADAWAHADAVQRRVASAIGRVAQGAGSELDGLKRRLRRLKWVIITVLIPLVGALVSGVAYIYGRGYDEGIAAGWQRSMEQRIDRLEVRADRNGRTSP